MPKTKKKHLRKKSKKKQRGGGWGDDELWKDSIRGEAGSVNLALSSNDITDFIENPDNFRNDFINRHVTYTHKDVTKKKYLFAGPEIHKAYSKIHFTPDVLKKKIDYWKTKFTKKLAEERTNRSNYISKTSEVRTEISNNNALKAINNYIIILVYTYLRFLKPIGKNLFGWESKDENADEAYDEVSALKEFDSNEVLEALRNELKSFGITNLDKIIHKSNDYDSTDFTRFMEAHFSVEDTILRMYVVRPELQHLDRETLNTRANKIIKYVKSINNGNLTFWEKGVNPDAKRGERKVWESLKFYPKLLELADEFAKEETGERDGNHTDSDDVPTPNTNPTAADTDDDTGDDDVPKQPTRGLLDPVGPLYPNGGKRTKRRHKQSRHKRGTKRRHKQSRHKKSTKRRRRN